MKNLGSKSSLGHSDILKVLWTCQAGPVGMENQPGTCYPVKLLGFACFFFTMEALSCKKQFLSQGA